MQVSDASGSCMPSVLLLLQAASKKAAKLARRQAAAAEAAGDAARAVSSTGRVADAAEDGEEAAEEERGEARQGLGGGAGMSFQFAVFERHTKGKLPRLTRKAPGSCFLCPFGVHCCC